jgi:hypothetical protein
MLPPRGNHQHLANTNTTPVVRLVVLEFSPPAIDRLCLNNDDDDVDQHAVSNNNHHKMDNGECADETTSNHSNHSSSSHYSHYSVFRPSSLFGRQDDHDDDNNNHDGGRVAGYDDEEEGSSDGEFGLGGVDDFAGEQPPLQSHSHHHRQHHHHRHRQQQHKKKKEDLSLLTGALYPSSQHSTTAATSTTTSAASQSQQQLQLLQHYNGNNTNLSSSLHSAATATVTTATTKPHHQHHQATFVRFASDEKGKLLMNVCHFPKYSARDRKHVWYRGRDFKSFLRRAQTKAARSSASSDINSSASSSGGSAAQYLQSIEGLRTLCSQKAESIKSQHVTIRHYCHCIAYSPLRGLEPFVAGTTERRKQVIHSILDEQDQWLALGNILTEEERMDALGVHCRTMTKPHRRIAHYLATGDALVVVAARQHRLGGGGGGDDDDDQPDGNSFVMDPEDCAQLEI